MKKKTIIIIVAIVVALAGLGFGGYKYREYKDSQQFMEWLSVRQDADAFYDKFYKQRNNISVGFYNGEEIIKIDSHSEPYIDYAIRAKYDPKNEDYLLEDCIEMFKKYKAALTTSIVVYNECNDRVKARIDSYQKD
jgi:hypothetical protein